MLDRTEILARIPHQGAMCLLDEAVRWSSKRIRCRARSHLDPANPLRRAGRLGALAGVEYGMQAAALHGAVRSEDAPRPRGYLASLRDVALHTAWLDDPAHGALIVAAEMLHADPSGLLYAFRIATEHGRDLVTGRGTVMLPPCSAGLALPLHEEPRGYRADGGWD